MRRISLFIVLLVCLAPSATAQTKEQFLPAGTLLRCTIDEPKFSSQTAQVGDPVLCHLGPLGMFGRPVFPRGAYLSGRLEDYRDPGHFFGKGWLKLDFNSLALPGGTFPLEAKVVSVPHYRVDADAKIHGRGHPRRDAIEWAIPVLWPVKVITLPRRGPRPALKGETRIALRLLDDVYILAAAATTSSSMLLLPGPPEAKSSSTDGFLPRLRYGGASVPAADAALPLADFESAIMQAQIAGAHQSAERHQRPPKLTLLILKDGRAFVVPDYWVEAGQLLYPGSDGTPQVLSFDDLDLQMTVQLNSERDVPFVLRSKVTEP